MISYAFATMTGPASDWACASTSLKGIYRAITRKVEPGTPAITLCTLRLEPTSHGLVGFPVQPRHNEGRSTGWPGR